MVSISETARSSVCKTHRTHLWPNRPCNTFAHTLGAAHRPPDFASSGEFYGSISGMSRSAVCKRIDIRVVQIGLLTPRPPGFESAGPVDDSVLRTVRSELCKTHLPRCPHRPWGGIGLPVRAARRPPDIGSVGSAGGWISGATRNPRGVNRTDRPVARIGRSVSRPPRKSGQLATRLRIIGGCRLVDFGNPAIGGN